MVSLHWYVLQMLKHHSSASTFNTPACARLKIALSTQIQPHDEVAPKRCSLLELCNHSWEFSLRNQTSAAGFADSTSTFFAGASATSGAGAWRGFAGTARAVGPNQVPPRTLFAASVLVSWQSAHSGQSSQASLSLSGEPARILPRCSTQS